MLTLSSPPQFNGENAHWNDRIRAKEPSFPRGAIHLYGLWNRFNFIYIYLRGRKQMVSRSLYHDTKRKGNEIRS